MLWPRMRRYKPVQRTPMSWPWPEAIEAQAKGIRAAELEHADKHKPMYPDTRFLTLCTLDGRRGGEVTVGESRLPVAPILGLIREHGEQEAAVMWPQLSADELAVLVRLVADIDEHETDAGDEP